MNQDVNSQPSMAQQALQSMGQSQQQQNYIPSAPQPHESGNFLTHLLPMAGGILGTMLAPETGGLSLLAGAALGGLGGAAGKGIENIAEGKDIGSGVLDSGIENTLGSMAGAGIGKALGGAGKFLSNRGATGLADEASNAATIAAHARDQEKAMTAFKDAKDTKNAWWKIKPAILEKNDLAGKQALAEKLGIDKNSHQAFIDTASNANDVFNSQLNDILAKHGTIDTNSLHDIVKSTIGEHSGLLGTSDAVAVGRGKMGLPNTPAAQLKAQLDNLMAGISNRTSADPIEMRKMIGTLGKVTEKARPGVAANTGAIDPVQEAKYNALGGIYNKFKDVLYNRPGLNEDVTALRGNLLPEHVGGNALLANHVNDALSAAKTPQDIIDQLKTFTEMSKLGKAGIQVSKNPATVAKVSEAKNALPGSPEIVLAPNSGLAENVISAASNFPTSRPEMLASILKHAATFGATGGKTGEVTKSFGDILSRIGPLAGLSAGVGAANLPNLGSDGTSAATQGQPTLGNATNGGNMQTQHGQTPFDNLTQAMIAQSVLAPSTAGESGATSFLSQLAPQLQRKQQLEAMLPGLQQSFNNAGGAQGLGGIGSILASLVPGTAAHTYQSQLGSSAATLGAALGISPDQASALLPQLMQEAPVANQRMGNLNNILGSIAGG